VKELIKKILREQEDDGMDTHAEKVQDLKSADDLGGWRNPITDDSPGNVPPNSYMGQNYDGKTKRYYKPTISKNIFFKALEILCKMKDASWFTQNEELDDNLWQRQQDMSTPLKVLGINEDGGLTDKIFWAANDNREGIVGGSITGYDQLYLRPLIQYDIPLFESVREYKTVSWVPTVECYSKEDAFAMVIYDEDGAYDSYEWESDKYNYSSDTDDWESEGKEQDGEITVAKVIYQAEKGSEPVGDPNLGKVQESIIKEMGPGPEENDIMSELQELVDKWYACEEGMEVACSYKNQVQEIIDRYKSKPLT
tara:strand:- start:593 stop:1522 length:930 start_codon:yes stop_codon:yes gene_type:complete